MKSVYMIKVKNRISKWNVWCDKKTKNFFLIIAMIVFSPFILIIAVAEWWDNNESLWESIKDMFS